MSNMNILWVSQKNAFTLLHIGINWYQHSAQQQQQYESQKRYNPHIYTFLCVLNVTEWSCKTMGGTLAVIHLAHNIHVLKSYSPLFKWKPHTVKQHTICPVRWKHQQELLRRWRLVLVLIKLIRYQMVHYNHLCSVALCSSLGSLLRDTFQCNKHLILYSNVALSIAKVHEHCTGSCTATVHSNART